MTQTNPDFRPWWRRVPSARRLAVFLPITAALGYGALTVGNTYINNVVPIQVAIENTHSKPGTLTVGETKTPDASLKEIVSTPGLLAFAGQERMNILVLGIDYDYTDSDQPFSKNARSDSTMVLSLDNQASLLNAVSIPRDSRVEITPKHGLDKINVAYSLGGVAQAQATIGGFLKTNLDHYVVVKVDAATKLIDAVGGIDIDVEKNMDYDDNWGHLHVHLKKGMQHLNGPQAVGYCRFRHDDESDRGRMRRQQQVIQVLIGKLHRPGILEDVNGIASVIKKSVDTDLNPMQILDLARLYASFDRKKMKTAQLAGDDAMIDGVSYLIPVDEKNKPIIRDMLKDPKELIVEDARIEVLNGSGVGGIARQTADLLTKRGFQVVRVGDADRNDYPTTQIVDHLRNHRVRSKLMEVLSQAQIEEAPSASNVDVTIIVGRDGDLSAADTPVPAPSIDSAPPSYPVARSRRPATPTSTASPTADPPAPEATPVAPLRGAEGTHLVPPGPG